jgi:hypothetical protein
MASSINASTSAGLVSTADTSGVLQLQTAGTTAVSINASQAVTFSAGTTNGVAYLNGSKVLTTGSALTFDGTNLGVGGTASGSKLHVINAGTVSAKVENTVGTGAAFSQFKNTAGSTILGQDATGGYLLTDYAAPLLFYINNAEQMRLNSTGLLVGTTSNPQNSKLMVGGTVQVKPAANNSLEIFGPNSGTGIRLFARNDAGTLNRLELQGGQVIFPLTSGADGLYFDATSGNLGLGVTPSAWGGAGLPAFQRGSSSFFEYGYNNSIVGSNFYFDGTSNRYFSNGFASYYQQFSGGHAWVTAPSGTAGNAITFTQAMTLDASGNLGIGTTSPSTYGKVVSFGGTLSLVTDTSAQRRLSFWSTSNGNSENAYIQVQNDGATTNTGEMLFATRNSGGTLVERMRLDASGNLGLGVTPSAWQTSFSVMNLGSNAYMFGRSSGVNQTEVGMNAYYNSGWKYVANSTALRYLQDGLSGSHHWYTAPSGTAGNAITFTQAMTLDASGNLLVGCTGGGASGNAIISYGSGGNIQRIYSTQASSPSFSLISMFSDATTPSSPTGTLRVNITTNGGIGNFQANDSNLSDRREKTNFAPAKSYLDAICAIPVQTFNYIDQSEDDPGLTLGVVAQDVQAVAPELVMESNWGTTEEPKTRLSIYQTDLQYALMKCIQEQQTLIQSLADRIAQLEAK